MLYINIILLKDNKHKWITIDSIKYNYYKNYFEEQGNEINIIEDQSNNKNISEDYKKGFNDTLVVNKSLKDNKHNWITIDTIEYKRLKNYYDTATNADIIINNKKVIEQSISTYSSEEPNLFDYLESSNNKKAVLIEHSRLSYLNVFYPLDLNKKLFYIFNTQLNTTIYRIKFTIEYTDRHDYEVNKIRLKEVILRKYINIYTIKYLNVKLISFNYVSIYIQYIYINSMYNNIIIMSYINYIIININNKNSIIMCYMDYAEKTPQTNFEKKKYVTIGNSNIHLHKNIFNIYNIDNTYSNKTDLNLLKTTETMYNTVVHHNYCIYINYLKIKTLSNHIKAYKCYTSLIKWIHLEIPYVKNVLLKLIDIIT